MVLMWQGRTDSQWIKLSKRHARGNHGQGLEKTNIQVINSSTGLLTTEAQVLLHAEHCLSCGEIAASRSLD
jgi:hypothetical protein